MKKPAYLRSEAAERRPWCATAPSVRSATKKRAASKRFSKSQPPPKGGGYGSNPRLIRGARVELGHPDQVVTRGGLRHFPFVYLGERSRIAALGGMYSKEYDLIFVFVEPYWDVNRIPSARKVPAVLPVVEPIL